MANLTTKMRLAGHLIAVQKPFVHDILSQLCIFVFFLCVISALKRLGKRLQIFESRVSNRNKENCKGQIGIALRDTTVQLLKCSFGLILLT